MGNVFENINLNANDNDNSEEGKELDMSIEKNTDNEIRRRNY